jgi:hypothetical protein
MALTSKPKRYSWAVDRELIELAKANDLEAIVKATRRKPEAILKMARRLGISVSSAGRLKAKGK